MPDIHAMLSASSSHRWLVCTPSAKLEATCPEESSPYAEEGTKAHALAEKRLKYFLEKGKLLTRKPKDVEQEMWDATGAYVDICIEKIAEARLASADAQVHVEQRLDFSEWVPGGFGTGDMVIVSDKYIEIVDLKYGKGVRVDAKRNSQMMLYALGAHQACGLMYGYNKVKMTIVQPRIDNESTWEIPLEELLDWGEAIVPVAKAAAAGEGDKSPGEHCRFCKYRMKCRELSEYMMEEVKTDFASSELTEAELTAICLKAKDIKRWLTEVEEYALGKALEGHTFEGLKLVEGTSRRKITDEKRAAELLSGEYSEAEIYKPRELQPLTTLEKLVGKKHLAELIGEVIEKPQGKPTLVSIDDKRPVMVPGDAKNDFDDSLLKG